MSVLESIIYTRKDGQYLRWGHRSGCHLKGKKFDKGRIPSLEHALNRQLLVMLEDMDNLELFSCGHNDSDVQIRLHSGSCQTILPEFTAKDIDLVVTSRPYCNRYDYTRMDAIEFAYLGVSADQLKQFRQELLSCTVENRTKVEKLCHQYDSAATSRLFASALAAFESQQVLQEVLSVLDAKRSQGLLNNTNVPRMVRNYFLESAIVIFEFSRVVGSNGNVIMVNDNVQYVGEEVPVGLILSDIAQTAGFETEHIWTLGREKGNSS